MPARYAVTVPMKPLEQAKSRLSDVLTRAQRSALVLELLDRVLKAAASSADNEVWVVGGDGPVKDVALRCGAKWLADEAGGLNEALRRCFEASLREGMVPVYVPSDLPLVTGEDVEALFQASEGGKRLVLAPAHRDGGTNAIVAPAGSPFRPMLGHSSFQAHVAQARQLGLHVAVCDRPGLGLDLDTPDDLEALEALHPGLLASLTGEAALGRRHAL